MSARRGRRSIRLREYDYSTPGAYFITIVVKEREHLFGEIRGGEMRLNEFGEIVWEIWRLLPQRYSRIEIDAAIVMPNHFHGILWIVEGEVGRIHEFSQLQKRESREEDLETRRVRRRRMLLPLVVGYFKMNTAKRINELRDTPGVPVWQRNYYEHIIRNERALNRIRRYILSNPFRWQEDGENSS